MEVIVELNFELKLEILPDEAKRDLLKFYEFLVFKYLKNKEVSKNAVVNENESLENFYRFKQLRNRINPRVDKSIDIDKLANEVNRDIF
jgi:hypothetical protein